MSNIQVTVAGLGKRSLVSVNGPSSPIYQILEDFCKKHGLDVAKHDLMLSKRTPLRKTRNIDLSLPWRLSGLSNHTELEIVLKNEKSAAAKTGDNSTSRPTKVATATIGFQLHDGRRFKEILPIDYNLWQCLRALECRHADEKVNVTQVVKLTTRHYCVPVVSAMNNAYNSTLEELTKTKLTELGISSGGNMLLRISFKETDQTFEQVAPVLIELNKMGSVTEETSVAAANPTIPTTYSASHPSSVTTHETAVSSTTQQEVVTSVTTKIEESSTTMASDEKPQDEEDEEMDQPIDNTLELENTVARDIKLYFTPQHTTSSAQNDIDDITDEDFEIKPHELQKMLAEQEKKKKETEVLRTKKSRDLENEKKKRVYDRAIIRVRFPTLDGLIIQGTFNPTHTLQDVYDFVTQVISDSTVPFYMFISPPMQKFTKEDLSKTLQQLKLIPAAIININVDSSKAPSSQLIIKEDLLQYLQRIQTEILPDNLNKQQTSQPLAASSGRGRTLGGGDPNKKPKWFKM